MQWSRQQDTALDAVRDWLAAADRPVFRLFGYAGTGKTTLAKHIAASADGDVAFAAYTGKAAHVMRMRGCTGAGTVHSLIYRTRGEDENGPTFALNDDSAAGRAELIIIDECSMIDETVGRDLLSFRTPVLVLGDPAQLPPVSGGGFFTEAEPDVMLTEVHRQAADNPIIRMSMTVREGGRLEVGSYGESRIIDRADLDQEDALSADTLLVGRNVTRNSYNARLRTLRGLEGPHPVADDVLVCLRNDRRRGLLNGSLWTVAEVLSRRRGMLRYRVAPQDDEVGRARLVTIHPALFEGRAETLSPAARRRTDSFDYGYTLTVHKAQGSQWDDVMLFDESFAFREHRDRWLYTGITRASERLTLVR